MSRIWTSESWFIFSPHPNNALAKESNPEIAFFHSNAVLFLAKIHTNHTEIVTVYDLTVL